MEKNTVISSLEISNFTVFENQKFEFTPGINIVIGVNGAGKSHLLKILYSATYMCWKNRLNENTDRSNGNISATYAQKLIRVFKATSTSAAFLRNKAENFSIAIKFSGLNPGLMSLSMSGKGGIGTDNATLVEEPLFIPAADVLSQYKGLIYGYERGYESRDETFRDLCSALSGVETISLNDVMLGVVDKIERIIEGTIELKDDEFYIKTGSRLLEIAFAAEGHRKLAMLAHLIKNGTLREGSILFWDEPETNLNPKLIREIVGIIRELAAAGVQVFVATHDYLVTYELGMAVKYKTEPNVPVKFFALYKESKRKNSPTIHESSDDISGLEHNSILDEFAAHYDRETALFAKSFRGEK